MTTPRRAFRLLLEFSVPLIAGVIAALVWANLWPHSYHQLVHGSPFGEGSHMNLHFLVNDIFMALFFGIAAKEITESALPGGALNPPRKAINPLLATIGGVVGPIAVYFAYVHFTGDDAIARGWGIPTATDIAIAWLIARVAFGGSHPAVSFLLLLAVADDGIGLAIIAIFYPNPAHPVQPAYLLVILAAAAFAYALRRKGVRNYWAYLLGPGILSWSGFFLAHLHPALALVPVVPFMPHGGKDEGLFAEDGRTKLYTDTLNQFEHAFKVPVDLGLFVFGLANAGVVLSSVGNATYAVLVALVVGKTLGIFLFSYVGDRMGFLMPEGMNATSLFLVGMTASLGLTVALFVAGVAFTDPALQGAAKMGALLSVAAAPVIILIARIARVRHAEPEPVEPLASIAPAPAE